MKRWWGLCGAALLVVVVLLAQISPVLNPPRWDEFIVVYDAHRAASGQVPYRDFFNFIPPGVFLFLAVPFKAAGASTLTLGRYASLASLLAAFALFACALRRRGWSPVLALLWAAVLPVCLYGFWAVPSHHWLAAAAAALLLAVLSGPEPLRPWRWGAAGCAVGLAGLCVQTAGTALAAFSLVLLLLCGEGRWRSALAWSAGLVAAWLPVLIWFGSTSALGPFLRDTLLWPLRNYSREGNENAGAALQDLPWRLSDLWHGLAASPVMPRAISSGAGFLLYASLAIAGVALAVACGLALIRLLRRRRIADPWVAASLLATALAAGLAARGSANWLHLIFLLALVGPLWLASAGGGSLWSPAVRRGAAYLLCVLLFSGALFHTRGLWFHMPQPWEFSDVDRATREQPVNRWLRAPGVLSPGDTIAAFPEGGEVYLYSAPAAVGYTYLLPLNRNYNTLLDHRAVAEEIALRRPAFVLVPPDMERDYLDPASPLSRVLLERYARQGKVGNAIIYGRRSP